MYRFTQKTKDWTSERLSYTGNKGTYSAHTATGIGYVRQLDAKTSELNNIQVGKGYELVVEGNKDVVASDKIIIDSVDYEVKGVQHDELGSINIKKVLLTKRTV